MSGFSYIDLLETPQGKSRILNRLAGRCLVEDSSLLSGDGEQTCFEIKSSHQLVGNQKLYWLYSLQYGLETTLSLSANLQARPTKDDHIEFWYTNLNLASAHDNWYRGTQSVYVFYKAGNTKTYFGDELNVSWTHMYMDGKLAFQATYGHLFTGGYFRENLGTSTNQIWGYVQIWMNF